MKKWFVYLLIVIMLLSLVAGCSRKPEVPAPTQSEFDPNDPNVVIEFDSNGKLLPLPNGFPSREIQINSAHPPGHSDEVEARLMAKLGEKYSPVPLIVQALGCGVRLHMEAKEKWDAMPGGKEGYYIAPASMHGLAQRFVVSDFLGKSIHDYNEMVLTVTQEGPNLVISRADAPWDTLEEMVAWAKANPGKLRFAISNVGSGAHVNAEILANGFGYEYTPVPTDGNNESILLTLGGGAEVTQGDPSGIIPLVESGEMKILLQTCSERADAFPDVPARLEYPEIAVIVPRVLGMVTHPDTPAAHRTWLLALIDKIYEEQEYQDFLYKRGFNFIDLKGEKAKDYVLDLHFGIRPIIEELDLAFKGSPDYGKRR